MELFIGNSWGIKEKSPFHLGLDFSCDMMNNRQKGDYFENYFNRTNTKSKYNENKFR